MEVNEKACTKQCLDKLKEIERDIESIKNAINAIRRMIISYDDTFNLDEFMRIDEIAKSFTYGLRELANMKQIHSDRITDRVWIGMDIGTGESQSASIYISEDEDDDDDDTEDDL